MRRYPRFDRQSSQGRDRAENGVRHAFVFIQPNAAQLAEIAGPADAEKLKVIVETILPLSDGTRSLELRERGHGKGKIVLRVV